MAMLIELGEGNAGFLLEGYERDFLEHHGIPKDKVFYAGAMKRAQYKEYMKEHGYLIAVGVTRCPEGHGMRSRHGQCIVCNPKGLAYSARHHREATVYVAHTKAGHLCKVGNSANLTDRFEQLNIHQYGGYADWVLLDSFNCLDAGRVEVAIHSRLARYSVDGEYGGRPESCRELFRCKPSVALAELRRVRKQLAPENDVASG